MPLVFLWTKILRIKHKALCMSLSVSAGEKKAKSTNSKLHMKEEGSGV
jgi:hypothetical protein